MSFLLDKKDNTGKRRTDSCSCLVDLAHVACDNLPGNYVISLIHKLHLGISAQVWSPLVHIGMYLL